MHVKDPVLRLYHETYTRVFTHHVFLNFENLGGVLDQSILICKSFFNLNYFDLIPSFHYANHEIMTYKKLIPRF